MPEPTSNAALAAHAAKFSGDFATQAQAFATLAVADAIDRAAERIATAIFHITYDEDGRPR